VLANSFSRAGDLFLADGPAQRPETSPGRRQSMPRPAPKCTWRRSVGHGQGRIVGQRGPPRGSGLSEGGSGQCPSPLPVLSGTSQATRPAR